MTTFQLESVNWDSLERLYTLELHDGHETVATVVLWYVGGETVIGFSARQDGGQPSEAEDWVTANDSFVFSACRDARLYSPDGYVQYPVVYADDDADKDHCRGGCSACLGVNGTVF